ncbi:tetratricopeptide repeat protein [Kribbella sp. NPDC026611]|uniref:ATP-binding protein n=1 Tax=Kribbella sp. NPDC026611 TaxID=3154911 RepID=UPI0033E1D00B
MSAIGKQVRAFRQRAGLTQEELAEKASLSVRSLRDLESGRVARPRARSIRLIAAALELADDETRRLLAVLADSTPTSPAEAGAGSATPPITPPISQLPADVTAFTGRFPALRRLDELVGDAAAPRTVVVSALGGTGKTALAVHWAHGVLSRFPDGQLYLDLRGFDPSQKPLDPADALGRFLTALGVAPAAQPTTLDERATLFRSLVAERRLLLILDNAASAAQVRPLLPGSPYCVSIVTSRDRLAGLVARDGAAPLQLDAMTESEAGDLLRGMVGDSRVDADRPAAADLIALCGRLPLAVRVVGANLALDHQRTLREAADALAAADRLDSLSLPDDPAASVLPAFELSYRPLADDLKLLFGRLGLLPGTSFGVHVVASAMATHAVDVERQLTQLVTLNWVQPLGDGRYVLHDLVKLFARRVAGDDADAVRRVLDYYLQSADAANQLINPARVRTPISAPAAGVVVEQFRTAEVALQWCNEELTTIADAVELAVREGLDEYAVQLPTAMIDYFQRYKHWPVWLGTHEQALQAAVRLGDKEREGILLRDTALVYRDLREHDRARELLESAAAIAREHGHRLPLARALSTLGIVAMDLGDNDSAMSYFDECVRIADEDGDQYAGMVASINLGFAHLRAERLADAAEAFERVLPVSRELSAGEVETVATGALAEISRLNGDPEGALQRFHESLALAEKLDEPLGRLSAHEAIARTLDQLGRRAEARRSYLAAAQIAADLGDPRERELHDAIENLDLA